MDDLIIKVSVICFTYNQDKYISRALNGFIKQKTNFRFEVIVHDDASTDRTPEIIRSFQKRYPKIIKPIFEKQNLFKQEKNILYTNRFLDLIKGKYVALCEGDDYWVDENKLQLQADYLDKHPDVSICFHPVKVIWEDNIFPEDVSPKDKNKKYFTYKKLLQENFIQTNSVMYRWCVKASMYPGWFLPGDWYLHLLHAKIGRIGYINKIMSVYYRNLNGIWTTKDKDSFYLKNCRPFFNFFKAVQDNFLYDESENIKDLVEHVAVAALRKGDLDIIKFLISDYNNFLITFNPSKKAEQRLEKYKRKLKRLKYIIAFLVLVILLFMIVWYI